MTTIITRLYANERSANAVADRLSSEGLPKSALKVVTGTDRDKIQHRLMQAQVHRDAAPVYAESVAGGTALLIVRATHKPLGAARIVREVTGSSKTIDVGVTQDDIYVRDLPDHAPSVLKEHPRFLTLPSEPEELQRGPISDLVGVRTLSKPRSRTSAIRGGAFMSQKFWPMKLVSKNRNAHSAIKGGAFMSKKFWPTALLAKKPRRNSVIRGGGTVFSRLFGWPTILRRS